MKKIKKLLVPLACAASSAAIVAPLVTSCGIASLSDRTDGVADTEVSNGYTPSIEKLSSAEMSVKEAKQAYMKAIKKDPNILDEDYKYFASQLNEFMSSSRNLLYLIYLYVLKGNGNETNNTKLGSTPWSENEFPFDFKINHFKAGLKDFTTDENGRVSYTSGIDVNVTLSIKVPTDMFSEFGSDDWTKYGIDLDLGIATTYNNFKGLDIKRSSSVFSDNFTFVRPVWPSNINADDWSLGIKINGGLNLSIDNVSVLNLPNIHVNETINHQFAWILEKSIFDLIPEDYLDKYLSILDKFSEQAQEVVYCLIRGFTVMDVLTYLGSFVSYYLSDIQCKQHMQVVEPIKLTVADESVPSYKGTIVFKLDEEYSSLLKLQALQMISLVPTQLMSPETYYDGGSYVYPFEVKRYFDETGKEVDDMCAIDFFYVMDKSGTRQKQRVIDLLLNGNALPFVTLRTSGDVYDWVEFHNDLFAMNTPFEYDKTDKIYSAADINGEMIGWTYYMPLIAQETIPAGSIFRIGSGPGMEGSLPFSIKSIKLNGQEFTDYTFLENVVILTNEEPLPVGSILTFTITFYGDTVDYKDGEPVLQVYSE